MPAHHREERRILETGGQPLSDYIWRRFEVRVFPKFCAKVKGRRYPIEYIHYRLHEAGYLTADRTNEEDDLLPAFLIQKSSMTLARSKVFRTNLKTSPIDLVSWIVAGCPIDLFS